MRRSLILAAGLAGVGTVIASADEIGYMQPSLTASLFPSEANADTTNFFPMEKCGEFELEEASIDQMQAAMAAGTLTSVQLVVCYMVRNFQTDDYAK